MNSPKKDKANKGLVHWKGREWITPKEFERRFQAALALGRRHDDEYKQRLIEMYGHIPEWAPERIKAGFRNDANV